MGNGAHGAGISAEVKARLRDNTREFHLESAGPNQWNLFEVQTARFTHDAGKASPTDLTFTNTQVAQPLLWNIRSTAKQPLAGVTVELNGKRIADLKDRALPPGGSLKYTGGAEAIICNSTWKELARVPVNTGAARVGPGPQQIEATSAEQSGASLKIEFRTLGPATRVVPP